MEYVKCGHGKWRARFYLIFDSNGLALVDLLQNKKCVYGIIDKEGNTGIKEFPLEGEHEIR
ncbi:hypothetical protein [uncultured Lactobacillus sp.]|uniref:hypothetical protein n=1 Tax=uncultured Lactobacillus sp. TaxID=153152 RepID=UPI002619DB11|nr:hypothetical protein [uncultured Lactobacillus sp.]